MAIQTHVAKDLISLYTIQDKHYYAENGSLYSLYIVPRTVIFEVLKTIDQKKTIDEKIDYLKRQVEKGVFKLMLK